MSRKAGKYAYLSCYSCPYCNVITDEYGKRLIRCNLSNKEWQMTGGRSVPEWCEIKVTHTKGDVWK